MEDIPDKKRKDKKEKISRDDLKHEYKDLSDNMRHYGNTEFAALTVLVTITTGLLIVFFTFDSSQPYFVHWIRCIIPYAGMLTAIVFGVILGSAIFVWNLLIERAADLEKVLGYKQYSTIKNSSFYKFRPTIVCIIVFCCGIFAFWLYVIKWLPHF